MRRSFHELANNVNDLEDELTVQFKIFMGTGDAVLYFSPDPKFSVPCKAYIGLRGG